MTPVPFDIDKELLKNEFRVTIFGSARIPESDPIYKDTFKLAQGVGEMGLDLITGGGPGLMEAASKGHQAGDTAGKAHSIGLNIILPFEQKPNESLDVVSNHERFSTRLDDFMLLSNVVVVMPGGIGTCLEFFYTWQLIQVKHVCRIPVILVGEMWRQLIFWAIDNPLKDGYFDAKDMESIVVVDDADEALEVIKKAKKHHEELGPDVCVNWKEYGKHFK